MRLSSLNALIIAAIAGGVAAIARADAKQEAADRRARALQEQFASFQKLPPPARDPATGLPLWRSLQLNERAVIVDDVRYDGVRFDVARQGREEFIWCFEHPENIDAWYILPAAGLMTGFNPDDWSVIEKKEVDRKTSTIDPSILDDHPELTLIPQALRGERLENGKTYLIWFAFTDDKPATLRYAHEFAALPRFRIKRSRGPLDLKRPMFSRHAENIIARRFGIELNANSIGPIIGILELWLERDAKTDELYVSYVGDNSDAEFAGVKKGDVLLFIDDFELKGKTNEEIYPHLGGKIGEVVPITLRRAGADEPLKLFMQRGYVNYEAPSTAPAPGTAPAVQSVGVE